MKNRPVGRPASTPSRLTSLPAASRAQDTIAERLAREGMHPQRRLQYRRAHVRGHRALQAQRLAYYEARKLDRLPDSLLDWHNDRAGRLTFAEKRARGPSRARRH